MSSINMCQYLPSDWSGLLGQSEIIKFPLRSNSSEYIKLANRFYFKYDGYSVYPECIIKVINPYVYGRYIVRQMEYDARLKPFETIDLFHATARSNVSSILKDNLDWRKVKRGKFGKGVSFSPSPKYANKECNKKNGPSRTMIVCEVIVGKSKPGYRNQQLPPPRTDTTTDTKGNVYVKFYDDEFYPKYLIDYTVDM